MYSTVTTIEPAVASAVAAVNVPKMIASVVPTLLVLAACVAAAIVAGEV
jgi:hypothetical protein